MKQRHNVKFTSEEVNFSLSHCFEKCALLRRYVFQNLYNSVLIQSEDCLSAVLLRALLGKSEDFSFCMKQRHNVQFTSEEVNFSPSHCFEKYALCRRKAFQNLYNSVLIQSEDCLSAVLPRALPGKSEDFPFCMKQRHNVQFTSEEANFSLSHCFEKCVMKF